MHHVECKIQISVIYKTHEFKLYTLSFFFFWWWNVWKWPRSVETCCWVI